MTLAGEKDVKPEHWPSKHKTVFTNETSVSI